MTDKITITYETPQGDFSVSIQHHDAISWPQFIDWIYNQAAQGLGYSVPSKGEQHE